MATPTVWKNVAVDLQSAIASAKTISAITKANPGVVTSAAHGYTDGDIVYLEVIGMREVNEKAVRVNNADTDTFELEGVDTTSFSTFTSGTAQEVTLDTSITSATNVSASGGDFSFIKTTTIHDNAESQIPGLPSAISYSMDHIWDATDAAQVAMKTASEAQERRVVKFTFGTGGRVMFIVGYCGFTGLPGGQAQNLVTSKGVFTSNGLPTFYSS